MSVEARPAGRDPIIALVVARAENGAIGIGGDLPWRLSTDLKQFRKVTLGKPVIMGRRTFQSLPRVLDGRRQYRALAGCRLRRARRDRWPTASRRDWRWRASAAQEAGVDEIMVIGGDDVFRAVMPLAKRIYLTEVHATPDADTWFKDFNLKDWRELSRERHEPGPKDEYPFSFVRPGTVAEISALGRIALSLPPSL